MIIRHLFISPSHNYRGHHGGPAGKNPILAVPGIECVAGRGIVADRYFDYKPDFKGQITFFEWENLVCMWEELNIPNEQRNPAVTRRNVIVEGLDLNSLIDREFEIQGVRFLGTEECSPCYWMNGAIHPQAEEWMKGRGGLRAKILQGGKLEHTQQLPTISLVSTLFAGGKSKRMGRDKAQFEIDGQALWSRQIRLLSSLGGSICVSAGRRPDWLPGGVEWVRDVEGCQGPLAGLLAALRWAREKSATHLVTLAVDLSRMEPHVLQQMQAACLPGCGIVPSVGDHYEPLAAVYPVEADRILQCAAEAGRWRLQDAVAELLAEGLLKPFTITEATAFHNMNTPEDIPR